jgi:hypothetical protein
MQIATSGCDEERLDERIPDPSLYPPDLSSSPP